MEKWTKEKCIMLAKQYQHRKDFYINHNNTYKAAQKKGWLVEICKHMDKSHSTNEKWNYESIKKESLKYKTKKDWKMNSPSSYSKSLKMGWHDEMCKHMIISGNLKNRMIYVAMFPDMKAYVGLTHDFESRKREHLGLKKLKHNNSSILKHINTNKLHPIFIKLTDYINVNEAIKLEKEFFLKYKNNGYSMLNQVKTGGIGGSLLKWDKNACLNEALKHKNRTEFFKKSIGAYVSAKKNGWLDEICGHMIKRKAWNKFWDLEKCLIFANMCENVKEFYVKYNSGYDAAQRNGWLKTLKYKNDK